MVAVGRELRPARSSDCIKILLVRLEEGWARWPLESASAELGKAVTRKEKLTISG